MTKEEAKELIEERKKLEIKIHVLRAEKFTAETNLWIIFDKLAELNQLYAEHRRLSEKIKTVERLA